MRDLAALGVRSDELLTLANEVWWRVHATAGPHVLAWNGLRHFGPLATARFDPHVPPPHLQEFGAIYGTESAIAALAETFQKRRVIDTVSRAPYLTAFALGAQVQVLDLAGSWPTRVGASQAINSGPRPFAQAWARAIHAAFPTLAGVIYPSSMFGGALCIALWEGAVDALPSAARLSLPLTHPQLRGRLANAALLIGYGLR
ncbi:MAG: RES family NAD+ phosphorylase [Candidatus Dormibacteria bacterium]